jgi:hypothetical protein
MVPWRACLSPVSQNPPSTPAKQRGSKNAPVVTAELGVGSLQGRVAEGLGLLDTVPVGFFVSRNHQPPAPLLLLLNSKKSFIPFLAWLCWDEFLDLAIATVYRGCVGRKDRSVVIRRGSSFVGLPWSNSLDLRVATRVVCARVGLVASHKQPY